MDDPRLHARASEIFLETRALAADRREERARLRCEGDPRLLRYVMELLAGDMVDVRGDPCEASGSGSFRGPDGAAAISQIGPYELGRRIGRGGSASVYEARQSVPVDRTVAIKIIDREATSDEARRRFERERIILGRLRHPGIAHLIDAGTTPDGRSFLVMPRLHGRSLVDHVNASQPSLAARIELLIQLCDAVQHAHANGIVHRDLKPSNIIVETDASGPRVVVIDFGIALLTDSEARTNEPAITLMGQMVGTPAYAAPEQFESGPGLVDVRADVYSIGVLAWEIVSGRHPHDHEVPRTSAGLVELRRRILEDLPPVPSRILSASGEVRAISRSEYIRLRDELDWIILRCLSKAPADRWGSVAELTADLRRWHRGEATTERPPSSVARTMVWLRRHRRPILVGGLLAMSALTAAVSLTIGAQRSLRAARVEQDSLRELAAAQSLATRRTKEALAAARLQADVLRDVDPAVMAEGLGVALAETLARPEVGADPLDLRWRIGRTDLAPVAAEMFDAAVIEPGIRQARESFAEVPGGLASVLEGYAAARLRLGTADTAASLLEEALALRRSDPVGTDDARRETALELARVQGLIGNVQSSLSLLDRLIDERERVHGEDDARTVTVRHVKAQVLLGADRHREAIPIIRDVIVRRTRAFGPSSADTASSRAVLADLLAANPRTMSAAREEYEAVLAIESRRELTRDDFVDRVRLALAEACLRTGDFARATAAARDAVISLRERRGADHSSVLEGQLVRARAHARNRELATAATILDEIVPAIERRFGGHGPLAIAARSEAADVAARQDRVDDAIEHRAAILSAIDRPGQRSSHAVVHQLDAMSRLLPRAGRRKEAIAILDRIGDLNADLRGPDSLKALDTRRRQGMLLHEDGQALEAVAVLDQVIAGYRRTQGSESDRVLTTRLHRARALVDTDRAVEAIDAAMEIGEEFRTAEGVVSLRAISATIVAADALVACGRPVEALELLQAHMAECPSPRDPDFPRVIAPAFHQMSSRILKLRPTPDLAD